MTYYNARSTELGFKVTKFDDDLNVESTYDMIEDPSGSIKCMCPAGQRPTCRHRQMIDQLSTRVDTPWMLDFDTRAWVDPTGQARMTNETEEAEYARHEELRKTAPYIDAKDGFVSGPQGSLGSNLTATQVDERIKNYSGPIPGDSIMEEEVDRTLEAVHSLPDSHPFRRRL